VPEVIDAYNNAWRPTGTSDYLTGDDGFGVETMLASMDDGHVDRAVVCSLGQMVDNDYIRDVVATHPDRLIGFGQVNPRTPEAAATVRACARGGLRGIKLHPQMHGYHFADHGLLDPIFRACADSGLIVLVNALDDAFCHPFAIEEIAKDFPDVPVLIAHMGTVWNVLEAQIVAERGDHIYLETSTASLLEVKMAYRRLGAGKLVLGTDWPGSEFDLERAKIARAIPDPADRALIEGGNLGRLLEEPGR